MAQEQDEGFNPEACRDLIARVARLRARYELSGDVSMTEFTALMTARDDLIALVKLMYERSIYKDD